MTSEQLRAFLHVAREGRVSTAARGLGLSQSGLSRQLQALEAELGARLLVRTPSGAVLTAAARALKDAITEHVKQHFVPTGR